MINRMIRAAMLDVHVYEEVEADQTATLPAMLVVILASISGALVESFDPIGILFATLIGVLGWAIWAGVTYIIGAKLLPEPTTEANWGELARTTGFAQAPGLLAAIGILSFIAIPAGIILGLWGIATMVVAVRQALDYTSTIRAVVVVLLSFIPATIITVIALTPIFLLIGIE